MAIGGRQSNDTILCVEAVRAGYDNNMILNGLNLELRRGEVVSIVGPNGSGKSTLFKAIFGFIPVESGAVTVNDVDITNYRPQKVLAAGISFVPQLASVFPNMTVYENLELGLYLDKKASREDVAGRISAVAELFPSIQRKLRQPAGSLSGGERRMVEVARSLMARPDVLLLDEPSVGLSPTLVKDLLREVSGLSNRGEASILMIEQNARTALEISDWGYVLDAGVVKHEGPGSDLLLDEEVQRTFLGG